MIANRTRGKGPLGRALPPAAGVFLSAVLILALMLGGSLPRVAAKDRPPRSFSSQAAAIDYLVGPKADGRQYTALARFASRAATIDHFAALQAASRARMDPARFPSQAAAIDYFAALQAASRARMGTARFSSQAAAIDHFAALRAVSRARMGTARFSSQAAAIDYFVGLDAASRNESIVCSYAPAVLGPNPQPSHSWVLFTC
jgi:hypothetical protein